MSSVLLEIYLHLLHDIGTGCHIKERAEILAHFGKYLKSDEELSKEQVREALMFFRERVQPETLRLYWSLTPTLLHAYIGEEEEEEDEEDLILDNRCENCHGGEAVVRVTNYYLTHLCKDCFASHHFSTRNRVFLQAGECMLPNCTNKAPFHLDHHLFPHVRGSTRKFPMTSCENTPNTYICMRHVGQVLGVTNRYYQRKTDRYQTSIRKKKRKRGRGGEEEEEDTMKRVR